MARDGRQLEYVTNDDDCKLEYFYENRPDLSDSSDRIHPMNCVQMVSLEEYSEHP